MSAAGARGHCGASGAPVLTRTRLGRVRMPGDQSSQTRYSANSPWLVGDEMQFHQSTRRQLIALLAGAAVAWPCASQAQQQGRIPKVGVLWHAASAEEEGPLFTGLVE